MLELSKQLLDWIEIWTVGRQEEEPRPSSSDDIADGLAFVGTEIVENDDVPRLQGFDELGCDIGTGACALIGPSMTQGASNPIMA